MSVCLHIGPPKTATKSLQNSVFRGLGIAFENRPSWTRAVARAPTFWMPPREDGDLVVSDELLGDFAAFSPEQIAARLSSVFAKATILVCVRDPLDLFYSHYRQKLITEIEIQGGMIKKGLRYEPVTPAQFLASEWAGFLRSGTGFFAAIDIARLRAAFEAYFSFQTLDFALLRRDAGAFAAKVAEICDAKFTGAISWDNRTDDSKLEQALASLPPEAPDGLADRYRIFFRMELTPEYEEFIAIGPDRGSLTVARSNLMLGKVG